MRSMNVAQFIQFPFNNAGRDGIPGVDPKFTSSVNWADQNEVKQYYKSFKVESSEQISSSGDSFMGLSDLTGYYVYKIYGTPSSAPLSGGNGGHGGIGGLSGDIRVVSLGQPQQIQFEQKPGEIRFT